MPSSRQLPSLVVLLLSSVLLFSCQTSMAVRVSSYFPGSVLLMPARDAAPENASEKNLAAAAGSGANLTKMLERELATRGWEVSLAPAIEGQSHAAEITPNQALSCGRQANATYVLTASMGDLRDAAPFTIVDDYVVLDSARLVECASGEVVWELTEPFRAGDSAFGGPGGAVWSIAVLIGRSIDDSAK